MPKHSCAERRCAAMMPPPSHNPHQDALEQMIEQMLTEQRKARRAEKQRAWVERVKQKNQQANK